MGQGCSCSDSAATTTEEVGSNYFSGNKDRIDTPTLPAPKV
jgi:hypothetical protein